ncbi:MAG: threonylcarbamoyl-AMP synthase [Actinomycetales bacterium]|nr:threonylcarbamoyl-AMP synthase [Actinomycetales bacterium]
MQVVTTEVAEALAAIVAGHLCAIPTETVYGLGADATNRAAIARVFQAKNRPVDHPLIVHVANFSATRHWISGLPDWAEKLALACWPGPLTLVAERTALATNAITGGQDTVAVRVPNHPKTLDLLKDLESQGVPGLVAPSANLFGHVSPTCAEHVAGDLGTYLAEHGDLILDGGNCSVGIESTIVLATSVQPVILRPGAITAEMIQTITGLAVSQADKDAPRVAGHLASHYAPRAKVRIVTNPENESFIAGSALIALKNFETPEDLVRISMPETDSDFATHLYSAMRQADDLGLTNIYIVTPNESGLGVAIMDRVAKAAHDKLEVET